MKMRSKVFGAAALALSSGVVCSLMASERDVRFSKLLNEMELYNYSAYFLEKQIAGKPEDVDRLSVQLAETYIQQNKPDDALKIINSIPSTSPYYVEAQAALGKYLIRIGKYKESVLPLGKVFEYCKLNKDVPQDLKVCTSYLLAAYKELGMVKEMEEVQQFLYGGLPERDRNYYKALSDLDSAESLKETEQKNGKDAEFNAACEAFEKVLNPCLEKSSDENLNKTIKNQWTQIKAIYNNAQKVTDKQKMNSSNQMKKMWAPLSKSLATLQTKVSDASLRTSLNTGKNDLNKYLTGTLCPRWERMALFVDRNTLDSTKQKTLYTLDAKDWRSVVYSTISSLENIQWGGQDVTTALACTATAKAYIILDLYDDALKELAKNRDLFKACDESFAESKELQNSPGAQAKYWEARAYYAKSQAITDEAESLKALKGAFVNYGRLLKNYVGYPDGARAYSEFVRVADELAQRAPELADTVDAEKSKVPIPSGSSGDAGEEEVMEELVSPQVEQDYKAKKYSEVVEALMPILREKRNSSSLPPLLEKLVVSMAMLPDRNLEALALCGYMADKFPKSEYTPVVLLLAGNAIWNRKTTENKNDAIIIYEKFLETDIANQYAANVAMRVAQEYYNRAVLLGQEANKLPSGDEKAEMNKRVLALFAQAAEAFQRVIDNFSFNKVLAENAYLYLAMAYNSMENYLEAARTYRLYCEEKSEKPENMLTAKLSISDNLYKAAVELEKQSRLVREAAYAIPEKAAAPAAPVKTAEENKEDGKQLAGEAAASGQDSSEGASDAKEAESSGEKASSGAAAAAADAAVAADAAGSADTEKESSTEETTADAASGSDSGEGDNAGGESVVGEEVVVHDINTREGKLQQAEAMLRESVELYKEGAENIHELIKWLSPGGNYASVAQSSHALKIREDALSLLPWLQDGAGNKAQAAADFQSFISAYPKNKTVPQSMMRMGVIYTELGDNQKATEVLDRLSRDFKDTPEGKNAKFYLARSLYGNGNFDTSIGIFQEIFNTPELKSNLSTQNLRWIASNLYNCGGQRIPAGAKVALEAAKVLAGQLEQPVLTDWLSAETAARLKNDAEEREKTLLILKGKVLLDAGLAAYYAGNSEPQSLAYFTQAIELDKNTPYFYELYFGRADTLLKMKNYDKARQDLAQVALRANTTGQYSNYYKSQCLLGDTHLEEKNYAKAFSAFNIVAAPSFMAEETPETESTLSEEEKQKAAADALAAREWVEYAIYRTAYCAALLNRTQDRDKMVDKYKKHFVGGRFEKDIENLPAPEAGNTP